MEQSRDEGVGFGVGGALEAPAVLIDWLVGDPRGSSG
jgi:hypothetical protein